MVAVTGLSRTAAGEGLGAEAGRPCPPPWSRCSPTRWSCPRAAIPTPPWESSASWRRRIPSSTSCGTSGCGRSTSSSWGRCSWRSSRRLIGGALRPGGHLRRREHRLPGDHRRPGGGRGPLRAPAPLCRGSPAAGAAAPGGAACSLASACPEDMLDRNWQRLILTHLAEKPHLGVLTGSPITDMTHHPGGRAGPPEAHRGGRLPPGHLPGGAPGPHGGGERPAGALVRLPAGGARRQQVGRAMTDLQRMGGQAGPPETAGELTRAHRLRPGGGPAGLRPGGGRLHPGPGTADLHRRRVRPLPQRRRR